MRTRTDIDPANTWLISDTHFHHGNIAGYCHRPEDFDQIIVAEWRKVVKPDDRILHLGDLNYGNNARFKHMISKELTGEKWLMRGNHDAQSANYYRQCGFRLVKPFEIVYRGRQLDFESGQDSLSDHPGRVRYGGAWWDRQPLTVSFSHYPWNPEEEGVMPENHWRVHGHIHNNGYSRAGFVPFLKNHINLSCEQTRYSPVNMKLLLDAAILGEYTPTTDEQLEEVRQQRVENLERKKD